MAQEFKHPKGGDDGSLLAFLQRNRYLIVIFLEVQVGEHCKSVIYIGTIEKVVADWIAR